VALVEKWNRSINLVSRQDIGRLLSRHILDSLSVNKYMHGSKILDIGTGAGFPGVPLALVNPQRTFTLCDRMAKRIRFLQVVKSQLQLSNVELLEQDFSAKNRNTGSVDTIVARAVAPAAVLWPVLEPSLAEGGRMLLFTSTQAPEPESVAVAATVNPPYCGRTETVDIPGLQQPHYVEILERH
jgi:16S rRNA (guanine527-N7)-methyltransferase